MPYYYLPNKRVKKIYTRDWLDYQVEAAKRVHDFVEVWGSFNWANKHGRSRRTYAHHHFRNRTKISVLPLSLGLKLIYPILPCVDVYAGAGVCYTFLRIRNFCKNTIHTMVFIILLLEKLSIKMTLGGFLKLVFNLQ